MPDGDLWESIRAAAEAVTPPLVPGLTEVRVTRDQWKSLHKALGRNPDTPLFDGSANTAAALTGIPMRIVDDVRESTPWVEGWMKCPHCGTPANGHPGGSGCDAMVSVLDKDIIVCVRPPKPPTFTPDWSGVNLSRAIGQAFGDDEK